MQQQNNPLLYEHEVPLALQEVIVTMFQRGLELGLGSPRYSLWCSYFLLEWREPACPSQHIPWES